MMAVRLLLRYHAEMHGLRSVCLAAAVAWICVAPDAADAAPSIKFTTPMPGYPKAAKEARIEGSGVVRVTFDATGKPAKVEMAKSTGSLILDRNTILTVQQQWRSSGRQETTRSVEVDYRLPPSGQSHGKIPGQANISRLIPLIR